MTDLEKCETQDIAGATQRSRGHLLWDAHSCLPLNTCVDVSVLERHRLAGTTFVSINVGMDFNPWDQILRLLEYYNTAITALQDRFIIASTIDDIAEAARHGMLAIAFDLEGSEMLAGDRGRLATAYQLGVRQIHFAYNNDNRAAGGCHGRNIGLSAYGKTLVEAVNRIGMIMDCAHSAERTSMEIMEISEKPVIFSHANPGRLANHPRNISDDQIRACARSGGVVGITGIGIFLGEAEPDSEHMFRHIDHVVQLVGPCHAGIGLDYVYEGANDRPLGFDPETWWPTALGYNMGELPMAAPEALTRLPDIMLRHNYREDDVRAILGENFHRVAAQTWRSVEDNGADR